MIEIEEMTVIDETPEAVEAIITSDETIIIDGMMSAEIATIGEVTDQIEIVPVEAKMEEITAEDDIEITVVEDAMIDMMTDTKIGPLV